MVMGCYGIGVGRILASVVEHSHDDDGIIWPITVAPYHVHIVVLRPDDHEVAAVAETLLRDLEAAGVTVLIDDREETPGVKFKDADLMGMPIRLTVSPRNHKNGAVELKARDHSESGDIPYGDVVPRVRAMIDHMHAAIERVADAR